jgi:hypothetical protein
MDSQIIEIDPKNKPEKSNLRDSESEDLTIPQQRSNFRDNAFFVNIHSFMKDNMENFREHQISWIRRDGDQPKIHTN